MIEAVMFDYGGVLSTGGRPGTLYTVVSEHFGIPREELDLADFHDQLRRGQLCSQDFFDLMNQRYSAERPLTEDDYLGSADYIRRHAEVVYGLAEAIRASGAATGILSNVYRMSARKLLSLGRYEGFNPVILSCYEGLAKPDPDFFAVAIEKSGLNPEATLFIDDQSANLDAASSFGMQVLKSNEPEQVVADVVELFREENGVELELAA